jgi:CRISPR/Cas system-associated exonuclease Cas4 (RecB family)
MAPRSHQSPSSINTFKQCPRRYYYHYIKEIKVDGESIHLVRGNIAHEALEDFFDKVDISTISPSHYEFELRIILQNLLKQKWDAAKPKLEKVDLTKDQLEFYREETIQMTNNWINNFLKKLKERVNSYGLKESFNTIKPLTEVPFISDKHKVRGFIDAVHEIDGKVTLIDYKTSKREKMTPEYKLQLAIYALLYEEKYGKKPDSVGVDFLRHNSLYLKVDQELVDFAKLECKFIQEHTISEDIGDYSKKEGFLCNYCDFQEHCFGQKKIKEF